ncbi:MAG TPA: hypothetical protein VGL92_04920 [Acidimicrobiia bacterium]|jgi:hypothetical protein
MMIRKGVAAAGAALLLSGLSFVSPAFAGGANTDGAYTSDPTAPEAPSLNGNGDGNAYGKPCAGCVGKADDKNPPGQFPDGSDANAGYECDTNSGIGQTNPAHTGCVPVEPPLV